MATYAVDTNLQAYTVPDFQAPMDSVVKIAQQKQGLFDRGLNQVKNQYQLMSKLDVGGHTGAEEARDNYMKQATEDLKRIGTADFSLDENVGIANKVYDSLTSDKRIVEAVGLEKTFKRTVSQMEAMKNSSDEKVRAQYSDSRYGWVMNGKQKVLETDFDQFGKGAIRHREFVPVADHKTRLQKLYKELGFGNDIDHIDPSSPIYKITEKGGGSKNSKFVYDWYHNNLTDDEKKGIAIDEAYKAESTERALATTFGKDQAFEKVSESYVKELSRSTENMLKMTESTYGEYERTIKSKTGKSFTDLKQEDIDAAALTDRDRREVQEMWDSLKTKSETLGKLKTDLEKWSPGGERYNNFKALFKTDKDIALRDYAVTQESLSLASDHVNNTYSYKITKNDAWLEYNKDLLNEAKAKKAAEKKDEEAKKDAGPSETVVGSLPSENVTVNDKPSDLYEAALQTTNILDGQSATIKRRVLSNELSKEYGVPIDLLDKMTALTPKHEGYTKPFVDWAKGNGITEAMITTLAPVIFAGIDKEEAINKLKTGSVADVKEAMTEAGNRIIHDKKENSPEHADAFFKVWEIDNLKERKTQLHNKAVQEANLTPEGIPSIPKRPRFYNSAGNVILFGADKKLLGKEEFIDKNLGLVPTDIINNRRIQELSEEERRNSLSEYYDSALEPHLGRYKTALGKNEGLISPAVNIRIAGTADKFGGSLGQDVLLGLTAGLQQLFKSPDVSVLVGQEKFSKQIQGRGTLPKEHTTKMDYLNSLLTAASSDHKLISGIQMSIHPLTGKQVYTVRLVESAAVNLEGKENAKIVKTPEGLDTKFRQDIFLKGITISGIDIARMGSNSPILNMLHSGLVPKNLSPANNFDIKFVPQLRPEDGSSYFDVQVQKLSPKTNDAGELLISNGRVVYDTEPKPFKMPTPFEIQAGIGEPDKAVHNLYKLLTNEALIFKLSQDPELVKKAGIKTIADLSKLLNQK